MKDSVSILLAFLVMAGCDSATEPGERLNSSLPQVSLTIDHENLQILNANIFSSRYVDAKLDYEGRGNWVNVRYQGKSTRNLLKKNYQIRFPEDQLFEQRRFSILSSQFRDPSILRAFLSFELFRQTRLMTPQTRYVTLLLNKEYNGVYIMIEPIDEYFLRNRGKPEGALYQAIGGVAHFTLQDGTNLRLKFEKKLGNEENYTDLEYLMAFLDQTPTSAFPQTLERIFDVEGYLDYMAVSALIGNRDGFISNLHLYHDPQQQRFVVIPWDMDLTFELVAVDWNVGEANELNRRLIEVDDYRSTYRQKVQAHLEDLFSEQRLISLIDQTVLILRDAYEEDPFVQGDSIEREAENVKEFVRRRRTYLQTESASLP